MILDSLAFRVNNFYEPVSDFKTDQRRGDRNWRWYCRLPARCAWHQGFSVTVLERHAAPGGKMRGLSSVAGPIDAGPTVLTMLPVFEDLFRSSESKLKII